MMQKKDLCTACVFSHLICTNFLDAQWCILMLLIDKTWSFWKLFILIWSTSLTLHWKSLSSLSIMLLESQSIQWLSMYVGQLQIYLYLHTCSLFGVLIVLWSGVSLSPQCRLDHSCNISVLMKVIKASLKRCNKRFWTILSSACPNIKLIDTGWQT